MAMSVSVLYLHPGSSLFPDDLSYLWLVKLVWVCSGIVWASQDRFLSCTLQASSWVGNSETFKHIARRGVCSICMHSSLSINGPASASVWKTGWEWAREARPRTVHSGGIKGQGSKPHEDRSIYFIYLFIFLTLLVQLALFCKHLIFFVSCVWHLQHFYVVFCKCS